MVETLLSTVFLCILIIASIQMIIMVVNEMIANEAAFSISRVAVVSKESDMSAKTRMAFLYLFGTNYNLSNMSFIPYENPEQATEVQPQHTSNYESPIYIYNTSIKYIQSLMFGYLFTGNSGLSIGGINVMKCAARARMVKSPDEKFYDRSYPPQD